jgi:hypothetical protein
MPKNMVSKGKYGARGGIAGNERGMRMDIIWGVHSINSIIYYGDAKKWRQSACSTINGKHGPLPFIVSIVISKRQR